MPRRKIQSVGLRGGSGPWPRLTCVAVDQLCQPAFCRFERRRPDGGYVRNVVLRRACGLCATPIASHASAAGCSTTLRILANRYLTASAREASSAAWLIAISSAKSSLNTQPPRNDETRPQSIYHVNLICFLADAALPKHPFELSKSQKRKLRKWNTVKRLNAMGLSTAGCFRPRDARAIHRARAEARH